MTTLAAMRREQYARYQPMFWRPAAGAQDKQRPYLAKLVADNDVITLVSDQAGQVTGFLVAALTSAPGSTTPVASPARSMISWSPRPGNGRRLAPNCSARDWPGPGAAVPSRPSW